MESIGEIEAVADEDNVLHLVVVAGHRTLILFSASLEAEGYCNITGHSLGWEGFQERKKKRIASCCTGDAAAPKRSLVLVCPLSVLLGAHLRWDDKVSAC